MAEKKKLTSEEINKIARFVEDIEYGSVTIIVQDGRVIQIEKNEKVRLK